MYRRERYEPVRYRNAQLMKALNEWCINLKIWLYPEKCGNNIKFLQRTHPKPDTIDFDLRHLILIETLGRYGCKGLIQEISDFCITLKTNLYKEEVPALSALRWHRPKPAPEYFDDLFHRVYAELSKDSEPMRKS